MKKYVGGFLFSSDLTRVVMLLKERPAWQKGRLNVPGGLVEDNETSRAALTREIQEEVGINVSPASWRMVATLVVPETDAEIAFGAVRIPDTWAVRTMTDETAFVVMVENLESNRIVDGRQAPRTSGAGLFPYRILGTVPLYNIPWLVRMAKGKLLGDGCEYTIGEIRISPVPTRTA